MSEHDLFSFKSIQQILDIGLTRDVFYGMEKKGEIPSSLRKESNDSFRYWDTHSLALLGAQFSPLASPKINKGIIICNYLSKGGGSFKTTLVLNFAKFLAFRGKKILLVPLDFQMNLSKKFGFNNSLYNQKETGNFYPGITEVVSKKAHIEDVIYQTSFPNIDIIPESKNLISCEVSLLSMSFRERVIKEILTPLKSHYDAIIIDNNPSWSSLSFGALCASDVNVAAIGIDSNSHESIRDFIESLNEQLRGLILKDQIFVAGHMENNAVKQAILNDYQSTYRESFLKNNIRKSTIVDEANASGLSVFEYAPKSAVTDDYKRACYELWDRIVYSVNQFKQ